ncbi:NAD(P)H-dependent oxidoreductase [Neolewinella lacunae]|uniref:NAD(P)H-dependent oxidoreductase n=1 Tax=Neolewinella lacunae TaxID=1517758 RepID=A0A923PLM6_9BACT|nr:NAD(P)H-dependent oxidoreductase [Neolewinella lacunae]MBC6993946.1 NAD(P)H-dependent oxidoreductase [Neolewinella lacunae]MDN3634973.1 NAD(P)H-dependent oxidoreductase [Neolewinella lacunae]
MKKLIILGSSRKNGETKKVVSELMRISDWDLIDLTDFNISHFDYEHLNRTDDFIDLLKRITENYDVLIFATPVYWYSMSGIMKVFFDRLTDLLRIEKDTGRKLRGKYMAVISCSNGDNLGEMFWLPFKKSAEYLGMNYIADLHTYEGRMEDDKIAEFKQTIEEKTTPEHRV